MSNSSMKNSNLVPRSVVMAVKALDMVASEAMGIELQIDLIRTVVAAVVMEDTAILPLPILQEVL